MARDLRRSTGTGHGRDVLRFESIADQEMNGGRRRAEPFLGVVQSSTEQTLIIDLEFNNESEGAGKAKLSGNRPPRLPPSS